MACAASAPSPFQARATQLDVSPSGTRCCRSVIPRFHRWRALPPHLHLSKRVLPDSTLAPPAPVAAAALPRGCINMLATPMACAASAPSPLQACATDTSPLGPRCSCSLNVCVHRRVNLLTARTVSAFSLPNACVFRHKAGPPWHRLLPQLHQHIIAQLHLMCPPTRQPRRWRVPLSDYTPLMQASTDTLPALLAPEPPSTVSIRHPIVSKTSPHTHLTHQRPAQCRPLSPSHITEQARDNTRPHAPLCPVDLGLSDTFSASTALHHPAFHTAPAV